MKLLKGVGIETVSWGYYADADGGHLVPRSMQSVTNTYKHLGNPLAVAVKAAHAEGIEVFGAEIRAFRERLSEDKRRQQSKRDSLLLDAARLMAEERMLALMYAGDDIAWRNKLAAERAANAPSRKQAQKNLEELIGQIRTAKVIRVKGEAARMLPTGEVVEEDSVLKAPAALGALGDLLESGGYSFDLEYTVSPAKLMVSWVLRFEVDGSHVFELVTEDRLVLGEGGKAVMYKGKLKGNAEDVFYKKLIRVLEAGVPAKKGDK
jgi:hypothetical protein